MTTIMGYAISVLAYMFPPMTEREYRAFVDSIRERGIRMPIILWRGQVIDGRHRLLACKETGVEPAFEEIPEDADPVEYLLDLNDRRRHMNESQRAIAAHRIWEESSNGWRSLGEAGSANLHSYTLGEVAALCNVSRRLVIHAGNVFGKDSKAIPEMRQAAEQGTIAVSDASPVASMDPEMQRRAVAMVNAGDSRTVRTAAKLISQRADDLVGQDEEIAPVKCIGENIKLYRSTVAGLGKHIGQGSLDLIVVIPPREAPLQVFSEIAALADRALKDDGVLVVGADEARLPDILGMLKVRDLEWVRPFYMMFPDPVTTERERHSLSSPCLPLLVYGKPGCRLDGGDVVIRVPRPNEGASDRLDRISAGMELAVDRFARWGQAVCDPMLSGRSGSALAAQARGCAFIGADCDDSRLDLVAKALSTGDRGDAEVVERSREWRQMSFA